MRSEHSAPSGLWTYLAAICLLFADQITKFWAAAALPFGIPQPFLQPWLYFTLVHNDGAAFSLLRGQKWFLSLLALGVAIWLIRYERRLLSRHRLHLLALGCILAGALGNAFDRIRLGYVIDFLDLHSGGRNIWPIFNVADISINLGVALLVIYFWRHPQVIQEDRSPKSAS